jgi:hypothetical protein
MIKKDRLVVRSFFLIPVNSSNTVFLAYSGCAAGRAIYG